MHDLLVCGMWYVHVSYVSLRYLYVKKIVMCYVCDVMMGGVMYTCTSS